MRSHTTTTTLLVLVLVLALLLPTLPASAHRHHHRRATRHFGRRVLSHLRSSSSATSRHLRDHDHHDHHDHLHHFHSSRCFAALRACDSAAPAPAGSVAQRILASCRGRPLAERAERDRGHHHRHHHHRLRDHRRREVQRRGLRRYGSWFGARTARAGRGVGEKEASGRQEEEEEVEEEQEREERSRMDGFEPSEECCATVRSVMEEVGECVEEALGGEACKDDSRIVERIRARQKYMTEKCAAMA